ncbi:MAG: acyltransferase [Methylococcales bacterium]|nr:acyltransferase [Methylococcales bacterium]
MSNTKQVTRIAFLDHLRIFAFISVLIGHQFYDDIVTAAADSQLHATPKLLLGLLMPFVYAGGSGIIVFFLISGYIISQVLSLEQTSSFLIRRVFRIYPLYVTAVLIQKTIVHYEDWGFSFSLLVPQLLLIGDFFGTSYTLTGVEWTLRIEMVFYVFMAMLKATGFWGVRKHLLIFVLLITTGLMNQLPIFPDGLAIGVFKGYFLIYGPFLFLGAGFWLYEQAWISFSWFFALIIMVFVNYFNLISRYQSGWLPHHFAALGFLLFTVAWFFRSRFKVSTTILLLSDLTYGVYLFHNLMFDIFKENALELLSLKLGQKFLTLELLSLQQCANFLTLVSLFAFCFLLHRIIERPANKLGRIISLKVTEFKLGK